jgi:hypothetical protein
VSNKKTKVVQFDPEHTLKLDSVGQKILENNRILGFSVAIMRANDTIYNRGFGFQDLDKSEDVTN